MTHELTLSELVVKSQYLLKLQRDNNDRLTAFDPGQPG